MTTRCLNEFGAATAIPHGMGLSDASPAGLVESTPVEAGIARLDDGRPSSELMEDHFPQPDASDGEPEGHRLHGSETREVAAEGEGHDAEDTVAPELAARAHAGEADDVALKPVPAADEFEAAAQPGDFTVAADATDAGGQSGSGTSPDDESDDETAPPQPLTVVELPKNFDWRKLGWRRYGRSLPPLDPADRENLETSIKSRGFLGRILIDEQHNIVDGNARWVICMHTGIAPTVEMIKGLSEEEKEELALSCNLDRRQLDKEIAVQVFEERLDNLLKHQQKNPKKWTLKKIAKALGVSIATVSARRDLRLASEDENVSKPDARRKYDDNQKREAVRLINEGVAPADVSRKLVMHPKAVQRAVNEEKERQAGGDAAKGGKRKKFAAARPTETIEDIAAVDGVPELHRLALEKLGQDTQAYIDRLKARAAEARKDVEGASDIDELLDLSLCFSQGLAFAELRLRKMLSGGGELDVEAAATPGSSSPGKSGNKPDNHLRGIVMADEGQEVFVALPVGGGVIDNRNNCQAMYGPLPVDGVVRVRVEGFDSKRGLWKLQPQARQTPAPAPGAIAGSHRDDRCSPDTRLAGLKAGPKETGVTK
jgi:hypothetical protein